MIVTFDSRQVTVSLSLNVVASSVRQSDFGNVDLNVVFKHFHLEKVF